MSRRKGRKLSPDEAELWRGVASRTTPLDPRTTALNTASAELTPPTPAAKAKPDRTHVLPTRPSPPARPPQVDFNSEPQDALARAPPDMDRRRFEQLRRGRMDPEARLDLHGMTATRAHAALTAFILSAHSSGRRLVLVITGKGRAPADHGPAFHNHGVLRHSVPHWLALPPLAPRVLQIASAHARHGGSGAYYVYLRRPR